MYVYICDVNVYIVIINITHNEENAQSCNLCVRVYVCAGFGEMPHIPLTESIEYVLVYLKSNYIFQDKIL